MRLVEFEESKKQEKKNLENISYIENSFMRDMFEVFLFSILIDRKEISSADLQKMIKLTLAAGSEDRLKKSSNWKFNPGFYYTLIDGLTKEKYIKTDKRATPPSKREELFLILEPNKLKLAKEFVENSYGIFLATTQFLKREGK